MSERQNAPVSLDTEAAVVPAKEIKKRLSGLDEQTVPKDYRCVTGFIDVHDNILYWCICAFAEDFTVSVIEYGTYHEH